MYNYSKLINLSQNYLGCPFSHALDQASYLNFSSKDSIKFPNRCKKRNTCPFCNCIQGISRRSIFLDYCRDNTYFMTLTIPHYITTPLYLSLNLIRDTFRDFSRTPIFTKTFSGFEAFRSLEITFGENGFHPHYHLAFGSDHISVDVDESYFVDKIKRVYYECFANNLRSLDTVSSELYKTGFFAAHSYAPNAFHDYALDLKKTSSDDIRDYLYKTSLSYELFSSHTKKISATVPALYLYELLDICNSFATDMRSLLPDRIQKLITYCERYYFHNVPSSHVRFSSDSVKYCLEHYSSATRGIRFFTCSRSVSSLYSESKNFSVDELIGFFGALSLEDFSESVDKESLLYKAFVSRC